MRNQLRVPLSIATLVAIGACALPGCGGSTTGTASAGKVSGTVDGATLDVASVLVATGASETSPTSSSGQYYAVLVTNRAELTCSYVQDPSSNKNFANRVLLTLTVYNAAGDVAAGTYPVVTGTTGEPASGAQAEYETSTASCQDGLDLSATSGSITLTEASASGVSGSYAVTFGASGTFTGSFSAPICAQPDGGGGSSGPTACQP